MDDHVRFSGTKYEKGNNTNNGNHYKCGENCSKYGVVPRAPPKFIGKDPDFPGLFTQSTLYEKSD